jgi:hypothetical protein
MIQPTNRIGNGGLQSTSMVSISSLPKHGQAPRSGLHDVRDDVIPGVGSTSEPNRGAFLGVANPYNVARANKNGPALVQPSTEQIRAVWKSMPGCKSVIRPAANGGRPVVVYIPPGFDPQQPARLITAFHGHGGNIGEYLQSHGWLDRIRAVTEPGLAKHGADLTAADPQTIYVLAQADQPPFGYWMRPPESAQGLEKAALVQARLLTGDQPITVSERIVECHSGGGLALANAADQGELHADKINLLDAAYNNWGEKCVEYAVNQNRNGRRVRVESWYTKHASMVENNAEMCKQAEDTGYPGIVTTHDVTEETHQGVPPMHLGTP